MNRPTLRQLLLFSVLASALASANVGPSAVAADASAWVADAHSAVRLIAGARPQKAGDALRAGVEVKLAPGWKTYWRYPGDSGVPPRFDFARSTNVKSVTVSWPAPQRLPDASGDTIGYKGGVIWPLRIEPERADQPVRLALKLDYAICEKLCIPVEATTELPLSGEPSAQESLEHKPSEHEPALAAAEQRVPKRAALGEGSPTIRAVRRDGAMPRPRVTVDVAAPANEPLDLFVEGPSADWALPLPVPAPSSAGGRRFTFELDGLPPGADAKGAELRFTLVAPARATEVTTHLD